MNEEQINVGSWVRFYQGGRLVVGVVQYIEQDYIGEWQAKTDIGQVAFKNVVEVR